MKAFQRLSIMSRVFQILLLGLSAVRAAPHDEATPALRGARALKFGHHAEDPAESVTGSMGPERRRHVYFAFGHRG